MLSRFKNLWHAKRRQVLVAWLAAWPTLTSILYLLQPFSHDWPLPMRSLASATAMVIMMNFVSVPLVSALIVTLTGAKQGTRK